MNRKDAAQSGRGGYRENAGRKSTWRNRKTCTVRIPEIFAGTMIKLVRQLDNDSTADNKTESICVHNDSVTQSAGVHNDFVTQSLETLLARLKTGRQAAGKQTVFDNETKSNAGEYDNVSKSDTPVFPDNAGEQADIDAQSLLDEKDYVSNSKEALFDNDTKSSFNRSEAVKMAKTILKAKKSAKESIVRLLSGLYKTQIEKRELK